MDIPFSVMRLFGQPPGKMMQGKMIFAEGAVAAAVKGMLDPTTLAQSGSAPGARVHRPGSEHA